MKKSRGKKMVAVAIVFIIIAAILLYLSVELILCHNAVKQAYRRLKTYNAQTVELSSGKMTYVDSGEGEVLFVVHGISGGYDTIDMMKDKQGDYRIIVPSRFGYLGSDMPQDTTPLNQVNAFIELLDKLNIDKVFLFGTSAGGTIAIKFALEHPERVKGLILYSTAAPFLEKPTSYMKYAGVPKFLTNDFGMWICRHFFKPMMGMETDTIYSILPVKERRAGMINDAAVNNIDMAKNFDEYPIETLKVNSLIAQAKDDKMADYNQIAKSITRFPNCKFLVFETGGHLLENNPDLNVEFTKFIAENS